VELRDAPAAAGDLAEQPGVRSTKKSVTMHPPSIYILYICIVAGRRPAVRHGYYVKARAFT
jgi:hypothetical protein